MNLRKTVAGAAVALGSATVMLGLGGIAHADTANANAHTAPDLGGQLGDVASVGDLASVNTKDVDGKVQALNAQQPDVNAIVENVDSSATATLLGLTEPSGVPTGNASVDI
ncbi:hypothetical protein AB0A63_29630 [Lentzea sp. NPDC042327]|uniref:hypothetical protein n=1 Tax=Lentzea sp. NPDC042327 TaxID=3154801 RepID=UPI0033EE89D2